MTQILDAHGLLVFLEKEDGFKKGESFFMSAKEKLSLAMTKEHFAAAPLLSFMRA